MTLPNLLTLLRILAIPFFAIALWYGHHGKACAIFAFAGWAQAIDWTLDIGGRRPFAVTAYLVPTFELTILAAALATVAAMFVRSGLPAPYHPLFNVPAFARASQDRFFLLVKASDPSFDAAEVRRFLAALAPLEVHDVPT